ncbi:MAG TPA: hypothetical protein VHE35_26025 [Kofleriaceae bacterium]|nr:hypothetical protein [Kofleriaceae bacterium]
MKHHPWPEDATARVLRLCLWLALAAPGFYQLGLLAWTIAHRYPYPYDLEWMEGGVLHGAHRVATGDGLYPPPSVDYIPFLYTPLYPGLLAALSAFADLSYQLGRAVSIASLLGIGAVVLAQGKAALPGRRAAPGLVGAVLALGLFSAAYPFTGGWYDLVRADTLALLLMTGGLYAVLRWGRAGRGVWGHARIALAAALLALSFFAKQTGVLYVAAAIPLVVILDWRRAPTFIATAGVIGLGGTWLMQRATGGWFWFYIRDLHQAHDWNIDRFWRSFSLILLHQRGATVVLALGLAVVAACAVLRRQVPPAARALLAWTYVYAVSTLVGAIGWGTQYAHYNAYMPALLHGAMAAGLVVPSTYACAEVLLGGPDRPAGPRASRRDPIATVLAVAVAAALGVQCYEARWNPRPFVPTARDRAAGDELIALIRGLPGEVWVPSHPWYAHLAGKRMYVHRMGVKDVTTLWTTAGTAYDRLMHEYRFDQVQLAAALRRRQWDAIVLDNRDLHQEVGALPQNYRIDDLVPRTARPRLFSGATVVPDAIWVPAGRAVPPPGVTVLFDFEDTGFGQWTVMGSAWDGGPVSRELPGQAPVRKIGGRWFADSMHGGDEATGTLLSPPIVLGGSKLTMRLAGGSDDPGVRVELRVDGTAVRTAQPPSPPSERLSEISWDVRELQGRTAVIALVDTSTASWGHLDVDEIWLWP